MVPLQSCAPYLCGTIKAVLSQFSNPNACMHTANGLSLGMAYHSRAVPDTLLSQRHKQHSAFWIHPTQAHASFPSSLSFRWGKNLRSDIVEGCIPKKRHFHTFTLSLSHFHFHTFTFTLSLHSPFIHHKQRRNRNTAALHSQSHSFIHSFSGSLTHSHSLTHSLTVTHSLKVIHSLTAAHPPLTHSLSVNVALSE